MQFANQLLNQFKSNENAWMTVDKILDLSNDNNVKFYALQILDEAINVSLPLLTTIAFYIEICVCISLVTLEHHRRRKQAGHAQLHDPVGSEHA